MVRCNRTIEEHFMLSTYRESFSEARFAKLLYNTRKQQQVTLEQLSEGLCTPSMLSKIEKAERIPRRLLQKRLLERLGMDLVQFDNFLQKDDYEEWRERKRILDSIENDELDKAREYLKQYRSKITEEQNIEYQFYLVMQAQILQHKQVDSLTSEEKEIVQKEILALYEQAMVITLPKGEKTPLANQTLSILELNIILEYKSRIAVQVYKEQKEFDFLWNMYIELLEYVESYCYNEYVKAKIYPKIVFYMYDSVKLCLETEQIQKKEVYLKKMWKKVNHAISLLRNQEKTYYLIELLDSKVYLMEKLENYFSKTSRYSQQAWNALKQKTKDWKETLKSLYEEYGVSYQILDCCYLYQERKVYCLNDVIVKRRTMFGMTKKQLYKGICSEKTLERLEKGTGKAQMAIVAELLHRLLLSAEYLHQEIITEDRELLEEFEQFGYFINHYEFEEAEKWINKIENKIELDILNIQAIEKYKNLILFRTNRLSIERYIQELLKLLQYTIPFSNLLKNNSKWYLTESELILIYHIALAYKRTEEYTKAYEVSNYLYKWCKQCEQEDTIENHISMYECIMAFFVSLLGSMGRYEESNQLSKQLMSKCLKLKRMTVLCSNIYNIAWNQKKKNSITKENYNAKLNQCISFSQLCKEKKVTNFLKKQ